MPRRNPAAAPVADDAPALTLSTYRDHLLLVGMHPAQIQLLQQSPEGYDYWRQLSSAHLAVCIALDAHDPAIVALRHHLAERFGAADLPGLHRLIGWLTAERGMSKEQAENMLAADAADMLKADRAEKQVQQPANGKRQTKHRGRPNKADRPKTLLVLHALLTHHGWEEGGHVGNATAATLQELAALADVNPATVSRYLGTQFGDKANAHERYAVACVKGRIGGLLTLWQGKAGKQLAALLDHDGATSNDSD